MTNVFQKLKMLETFQNKDDNNFEYYKNLCKRQLLNGIMSKEMEYWFSKQVLKLK